MPSAEARLFPSRVRISWIQGLTSPESSFKGEGSDRKAIAFTVFRPLGICPVLIQNLRNKLCVNDVWRTFRRSARGGDMSVIIDFSIFPVDKGESVSPYVARAVKIIKDSGLPHKITPMGTCIEGEWDEVMGLVNRSFLAMKKDCGRVYLTVKADYREGASGRIERKVKSVEEKL